MNKERELKVLLDDSGASALVCHPDLYEQFARQVVPTTAVKTVICASETDFQTRSDRRVFAGVTTAVPDGVLDFRDLVDRYRGRRPRPPDSGPRTWRFSPIRRGRRGRPKGR